jgi:hypothetical protein
LRVLVGKSLVILEQFGGFFTNDDQVENDCLLVRLSSSKSSLAKPST